MKDDASRSWRQNGDDAAFDHEEWELRARQFQSSAMHCLQSFDARKDEPTFDSIMLLPTSEFLLSVALELLCKAYYLKKASGPPEDVYRHNVVDLVDAGFFSESQVVLMRHAERYVVWAGRYPTPKWTAERFKESYDVTSRMVGNIEHIDGAEIPNSASRSRCSELIDLCAYLRTAWANA